MKKMTLTGMLIAGLFAFNSCTENANDVQDNFLTAKMTRSMTPVNEIVYCGTFTAVDFLAGQTIDAGNIIVGNDEENLYITFQTENGWSMNASHLYIGEVAPVKSAPGQFPYKVIHTPGTTEYTYSFKLTDIPDCLVIAAHAEVVFTRLDGIVQSETAWGNGERINLKGNWSMMFNYCKQQCDPKGKLCYEEETAWATGPKFIEKGNWATYTPYGNIEQTIDIFAGQEFLAGTAHFSAPVNDEVTLTISLIDGWELNAGTAELAYEEAVKIQAYTTAPSGNPAPGLFTTYKGMDLTVKLPVSAFYGIHLDVRKIAPCEEVTK